MKPRYEHIQQEEDDDAAAAAVAAAVVAADADTETTMAVGTLASPAATVTTTSMKNKKHFGKVVGGVAEDLKNTKNVYQNLQYSNKQTKKVMKTPWVLLALDSMQMGV